MVKKLRYKDRKLCVGVFVGNRQFGYVRSYVPSRGFSTGEALVADVAGFTVVLLHSCRKPANPDTSSLLSCVDECMLNPGTSEFNKGLGFRIFERYSLMMKLGDMGPPRDKGLICNKNKSDGSRGYLDVLLPSDWDFLWTNDQYWIEKGADFSTEKSKARRQAVNSIC
ncbi:hypothetical protein RJT34_31462 [Clitoria ternatea]|uniref:Uncharacterized protein n=1 Tax=Clitoria ternatea TaxID=43366 RepID=A0AAN9EUC8_CLITE